MRADNSRVTGITGMKRFFQSKFFVDSTGAPNMIKATWHAISTITIIQTRRLQMSEDFLSLRINDGGFKNFLHDLGSMKDYADLKRLLPEVAADIERDIDEQEQLLRWLVASKGTRSKKHIGRCANLASGSIKFDESPMRWLVASKGTKGKKKTKTGGSTNLAFL